MVFISRLKLRNFKSFKAADVQLPATFTCFAGPNGSGKCVDGDTSIYLADGTTEKIRDLVEEALENGQIDRMDDGVIAQYGEAKEILALDTDTFKIKKMRISAFVKRTTPEKMLRVKTRSGKEIIATEYHPFFILENGNLRPIRADELKEKIRIAIPRTLPVTTTDTTFFEIMDMFDSNDHACVPYNEKLAKILRAKKRDRTWGQMESVTGVPRRTISCFVSSKQAILFSHLIRILRVFGFSKIEIAEAVGDIKGRRDCPMRIPWHNSNELCRFLGYMLAEGSISRTNSQVRITNGSDEIISDFKEITQKVFGLETHIYKYKKGAYDAIVNCAPLRRILLNFGMNYEGAGEKEIPKVILQHSTDEQLANILSGLYAGDGYVSKNGIELTLKSSKLIKAIEYILLRLGIVGRVTTTKKRETRTGFEGVYAKISIYGSENVRRFGDLIDIRHARKKARLEAFEKKPNPNVDLVEVNDIVRETASELGINVKRTKKEFPRLDSYCYNQCTPSRYGTKHLVSGLFRQITLQRNITSESLAKLEKITESDIFWDEVESIEKVAPREEWVYDLSIAEHHNFIANGIFVHNSNLCDAIRFVMGEMSLRSLRARKVTDLIHGGSRTAEVSLVLESSDGQGYEIRRAIREDGKIRYRLNDKKTTRGSVVEALKKYNLDSSGRNTIAQGEVQRIVNMNGKERRQIIDSVAGIADFEEKKREAISELDTVEIRIKEANLVMGERQAFLGELETEKETAIKYTNAKKNLTNAKGTVLKKEVERYGKELTNLNKQEEKFNETKKAKESEMAEIEARIGDVDVRRTKLSEELQSKQKTNAMIRRLEELKASCASKKQMVDDRDNTIRDIKIEIEELERETAKERESLAALEKEMTGLKNELKDAEEQLRQHGGATEDDRVTEIRRTLEKYETELSSVKEKLASVTSEIEAKRQVVDAKKAEEASIVVSENNGEREDINHTKREIDRIAKEIDQSFTKTKEINVQMTELDRQMLELKEKLSIFRVRSSPQLANPALSFIGELAKTANSGIHGTIADLISFDPQYSSAVEAAGGSRLLYVVVDDIDTATSVIEKLKKAKAGRATFIPLDSIRTPQSAKAGRFSSILDAINCKSNVRRAAEYVFADTILVDSVADAKKLGIGTGRMVTIDGEIFERSGIVSGGRTQSGLLNNSNLRKIENEFNDMKSTKESLLQELYSIREEESKMRAEKARLEIQVKTVEMKEKMESERREEAERLVRRKEQITREIAEFVESIKERSTEREHLAKKLIEAEGKLAGMKETLRAAESEYRRSSEESSKKMAELSAAVSSLKATIDGRYSEVEIRKKEHAAKEERHKKLAKDEKDSITKIKEVKKQIEEEEKELLHTEEKMKSASKEIERLFGQMRACEDELQEIGKKRGQIRMDLDKVAKDMNQFTVKTVTTKTRLEDMQVEFATYGSVEFLELEREELNNMIKQSEDILATIGNVNMAAIEMYDKKKAEIMGVQEKIEQLDQEREAILSMISEIDEHKKEAFFETFNSVSDNFSKMFKYINVGQGHLYLSNPSEPFESGLFIKLRRNNQEHALDALSGGEKTLVALMFVFALQMFKPAPFYILDEVDAALDKTNSKNLADLVNGMSKESQFIMVSHNDTVMANADSVIGVTKVDGVSKLVGIKLKQVMKETGGMK